MHIYVYTTINVKNCSRIATFTEICATFVDFAKLFAKYHTACWYYIASKNIILILYFILNYYILLYFITFYYIYFKFIIFYFEYYINIIFCIEYFIYLNTFITKKFAGVIRRI